LRQQSYALAEHCRAIARQRTRSDRLAMLTPGEIDEILHRLHRLIGR